MRRYLTVGGSGDSGKNQACRRGSEKMQARQGKPDERQEKVDEKIREAAEDILQSENFQSTKEYIQHGNVTVHSHCLNVAKYSVALSQKLRVSCSQRELIRGALLHDFFLYDWHSREHVPIYKLHGFFHPGVALKNASEEFELTSREKDIIKKHMWPLTVVPPGCREAWIVTMADKWVSLMETFHIIKGDEAQQGDGKEESAR